MTDWAVQSVIFFVKILPENCPILKNYLHNLLLILSLSL